MISHKWKFLGASETWKKKYHLIKNPNPDTLYVYRWQCDECGSIVQKNVIPSRSDTSVFFKENLYCDENTRNLWIIKKVTES